LEQELDAVQAWARALEEQAQARGTRERIRRLVLPPKRGTN
jgi:hypothetical protein